MAVVQADVRLAGDSIATDPGDHRPLVLPDQGLAPISAMGTRFWAVLVMLAAMLFATPARAVEPDEILPDARMESRARALSAELRCVVCQNQSIDDSNAPLARDLRLLVRERLKAGDSDDAVLRFVVARYGEFVLLRPPFSASTLLLWLGPSAMLLLTMIFLVMKVRRDKNIREAVTPPLNTDEKARLAALLQDQPKR